MSEIDRLSLAVQLQNDKINQLEFRVEELERKGEIQAQVNANLLTMMKALKEQLDILAEHAGIKK